MLEIELTLHGQGMKRCILLSCNWNATPVAVWKHHLVTTHSPCYYYYLFVFPKLFFFPPQLRHSHPYFNSPLSSFGPWEVLDIMHANTTSMVGMSAHVFFIRREEGGEQTRAMRHIAAQKTPQKTLVTCVEMSKVCFPCSVHFDAVTLAVGGFWLSLSSLSTGGSSSRSAHTSQ